ncbi:uncharacterized protein UV8b_04112 [Ustilaginoidea virens]|uniref:Uncharacterized protein n=1 Tax=Ustilaginoidea virens TaxID=1159556 RepID=A0A8E5HQT3_USTVR|nr:uncharacterized protein UV8b_04112 [Ustilaginoidea virens]QUC19871.1 hypothetical protein UV8b_04112 [Ustilaginoidea virens]
MQSSVSPRVHVCSPQRSVGRNLSSIEVPLPTQNISHIGRWEWPSSSSVTGAKVSPWVSIRLERSAIRGDQSCPESSSYVSRQAP